MLPSSNDKIGALHLFGEGDTLCEYLMINIDDEDRQGSSCADRQITSHLMSPASVQWQQTVRGKKRHCCRTHAHSYPMPGQLIHHSTTHIHIVRIAFAAAFCSFSSSFDYLISFPTPSHAVFPDLEVPTFRHCAVWEKFTNVTNERCAFSEWRRKEENMRENTHSTHLHVACTHNRGIRNAQCAWYAWWSLRSFTRDHSTRSTRKSSHKQQTTTATNELRCCTTAAAATETTLENWTFFFF